MPICSNLSVFDLKALRILDNVVSSAYTMKANRSLTFDISFIYIINSSGPRRDPCGPPVFISSISDFVLSKSTYCFLSVK